MELTKRKYISGSIHNSVRLNGSYVIVYDWGVVKINLNEVSEIEEYDSDFLFYTLKKNRDRDGGEDMDFASIESFCCFAFGKKILLTERHESLHDSVSNSMTYINLEKITMTNGNSYITII